LHHQNTSWTLDWELEKKKKVKILIMNLELTATQFLLPQIAFPSTPAVGVAILSIVFFYKDSDAAYLNFVYIFCWSIALPKLFFNMASIGVSFVSKLLI
tara:strand:- start:82 stop:378 length:297 start_codon:yes stop_codon:yes gene_type:complete